MGNSSTVHKNIVIIPKTTFVRPLESRIVSLNNGQFELLLLTVEEILQHLEKSEGKVRLIVEASMERELMEQLAAYRFLIEATPIRSNDAQEYLQNVRQVLKRMLCKNDGQLRELLVHVDIKFIDRDVHSAPYEIFLHYMHNRKMSYEIYQNVADFLLSQKKSRAQYIIVSSEFATYMFTNYSKVFCFCSRVDEFNAKLSDQITVKSVNKKCQSNFKKIIRLILNDKRRNRKDIRMFPLERIFFWKAGMRENIANELLNKNAVALQTGVDFREKITKEQYSLILFGDTTEKDRLLELIEEQHLDGRVVLLDCQHPESKYLANLDKIMETGLQLVPQSLKAVTVVGDQKYLEEVELMYMMLLRENIKVRLVNIDQFIREPHNPSVIVTNSKLSTYLKSFLQKLNFGSLIMCLNLCSQYWRLNSHAKSLIHQNHIRDMLKNINDDIYYISQDDFACPKIHRLVKKLKNFEDGTAIYIDVDNAAEKKNSCYTLKLTMIAAETPEEMKKQRWECLKKLWKLDYNPLQYVGLLQNHLQLSFMELARLGMIGANDLQKLFLEKIKKCKKFTDILHTVTQLYNDNPSLRYSIKATMSAIDKYADYEKIKHIRPIVAVLMMNFSGLFNYAKFEPFTTRINFYRTKAMALKIGDILSTNQFVEVALHDQLLKKCQCYIEIDYSEPAWAMEQFYSGVITKKQNPQAIMFAPYLQFRVTQIFQSSQNFVVKLRWINDMEPIRNIIQYNTFSITADFRLNTHLVKYSNMTSADEEEEMVAKIHFYRFLWYMQQKKLHKAYSRLSRCQLKINNKNNSIIKYAEVYYLIGMGEFHEAATILKTMPRCCQTSYWKKHLEHSKRSVQVEMSRKIQKKSDVMKWSVKYSEHIDQFNLTSQKTQVVYKSKIPNQLLNYMIDSFHLLEVPTVRLSSVENGLNMNQSRISCGMSYISQDNCNKLLQIEGSDVLRKSDIGNSFDGIMKTIPQLEDLVSGPISSASRKRQFDQFEESEQSDRSLKENIKPEIQQKSKKRLKVVRKIHRYR